MKKIFVIFTGVIFIFLAGCHSKTENLAAEGTESAGNSDILVKTKVKASDLLDRYIDIVCKKYEDCEIKIYANNEECKTRMAEVVSQSPEWNESKIEQDPERISTCLNDLENISCDDFKTGTMPESCVSSGEGEEE